MVGTLSDLNLLLVVGILSFKGIDGMPVHVVRQIRYLLKESIY